MKYYCDANFIICYLLGTGKGQNNLINSREIFEQIKTGKTSLILEQVVFVEIVLILASCYNVPNDKVSEVLAELLAYRGVVCENKESLSMALNLYSNKEMNIIECILAAKAKTSNTEILSYNQKLIDCCQRE